jgi:hypothetical chaperone protein
VGGDDFDQAFTWHHFLPLFGKDSLSRYGDRCIPSALFADAIATRDIPAQLRFNSSAAKIAALRRESLAPELVQRLGYLQSNLLQHRLVRSAELTKIALSGSETCLQRLRYIEADLGINCSRGEFETSVGRQLDQLERICLEALKQAGKSPDLVFITGGMGFSPAVRERIKAFLNVDVPVEFGDMMGSVGMGLGLQASRRIKAP